MHVSVKMIPGMMPNQGYAKAGGRRLYFRARRGEWEVCEADSFREIASGKSEWAGWWTDKTAEKRAKRLIAKALQQEAKKAG